MTLPDHTAPPRADLPFLRRRSLAAAPTHPRDASADKLALFVAGRLTSRLHGPNAVPARPAHPPQPPPQPSAGLLDLTPPAASTPSTPRTLTPPAPAPRPDPAPSPAPSPSASLDLFGAPAPVTQQARPVAPVRRGPKPVRALSGRSTILSLADPTVTLTALQSGIGTLEMEGVWPAGDGAEVRIGCAYQLRSGASSTVQLYSGRETAPSGSRRPIITGRSGDFEGLEIDLRQCGELERLIVYAFTTDGAAADWHGTFVTRTYGNARIEVPLADLQPSSLAVLLSIYNIGGQFVLRAELDSIQGSVRDGCQSYGFDQITWLDERTSID